ncbi:cell division protein ZapA [Acidicapsa dinghuensis]|uniref:Cell division protein ZapA n=1 Tax=Acidicapsa dinghuensis TaxID=2218256 RepID=A0ABW1EFL9_9BACT|nr:cell division protein ZapA [Acidicapsa dinghuensis]
MSQTKSGSDGSSTPDSSFVSVDIYDQTYHLSGPDPAQIQRLAARVDTCMRSVASASRTADSLRVAVLTALNFADEAARAEEQLQQLGATREAAESAELHSRAVRLRGLLDTVLDQPSEPAS